jgi:hypothetical protein
VHARFVSPAAAKLVSMADVGTAFWGVNLIKARVLLPPIYSGEQQSTRVLAALC